MRYSIFRKTILKDHKNIFVILLLSVALKGFSQDEPKGVQNQRKYDYEWLHFGFTLGENTTNFIVFPVKDFYTFDTLKVLESKPEPGFNLGIVSEVSIHKYVKVRFVPDLSFARRDLEYHFVTSTGSYVKYKKVESTFLDFPIDFKLKSKRINNFGMYVLGGGKYVVDLASQKEVNNANLSPNEQVIKLRKGDFAYNMGGGFDFYLEYFKFSIDLKLSVGVKNLLIQDHTLFSSPIEKLNSKVILLSFNFEG